MSSPNSTSLKLTPEQRDALAAHGRSVSLAAGAGCGKTFVLTERFLSYVDPQVAEPTAELHELVAITFTDAAAREMRERVRRRCYERLQQAADPQEQIAWRRLIREMDRARISTIHSFCATLLRSHPVEAEVDPHFEVLDASAAQLLRLQTLDDRLRELLVAGDQRVIELATRYGLQKLRDYVADLMSATAQPVIDRWSNATPEELVTHWTDYFRKVVTPVAVTALLEAEPIQRLRDLCHDADVAESKLQAHLQELTAAFSQLPHVDEPSTVLDRLHKLARVQGVCKKSDWHDQSQFEQYKTACDLVRKLLQGHLLRRPLVGQQLRSAAEVGLELLALVAEVTQVYERVKRDRNALEFDDVLAQAHRLLTDPRYPEVRKTLAEGTRLLMVDEFQDTDPLQVAIVQAFRGDRWADEGLFVVGDFKQSIYRFRGAEPRVSNELRQALPPESRLSLTTNFRSQGAILDFVNALFVSTFADDYDPLRPMRPQLSPTPSVEFLWALGSDDLDSEPASHRGGSDGARAKEARFIALRLAQMLDSNDKMIVDTADETPQTRPLRLGDIAILLRSLSDVALYEEALREQGLDYYLAGGHAFYAQQEIHDILHLLRAIASPADELSLAGALRSPLFSLQDESLYWLVETGGSLGRAILADAPPSQLTAAEQAKVQRAAATLRDLRDQKDRLLVAELLAAAIEQTGYDATLLASFMGERKLANVRKLIEQARTIDRTRPGDLNAFIAQLTEFVVRDPKEPPAATQAEGDVIRIMTIHHAKGLEFPLVVVPDLNRGNRQSTRQPHFDQRLGPLVPADDKLSNVGWDMHRLVEREQEIAERRRLLYVACTRAADYLLLSSSVDDLQRPKGDWLKLLAEHFDLQTGRCRVDLPDEWERPEVRVTCAEPIVDRDVASKSRRVNLTQVVADARQLAEAGGAVIPLSVAPIPKNSQARKQFSFSRLSGQFSGNSRSRATVVSADRGPSEIDPRGLGTLIHAVMEQVDFALMSNVTELCQRLAPSHLETNLLAASEAASTMIGRFLAGKRAAAISAAAVVRREVEFVMPWPFDAADSVIDNTGRYLHGYIDCLYQDATGGWHLVDYKSNHVDAAGVREAAQRYAMQMGVYAMACEQTLGAAPVESVLCFLHPGVEFAFEWEEAELAKVATQLDVAIEAQGICAGREDLNR